ncbi:hypothetical protein D3C81_897580 [compost metagenome]
MGGQLLVDVELPAQRRCLVLDVAEGPVGREQGVCLRRARHCQPGRQRYATIQAINVVTAGKQIHRNPRALATPVQPQRCQLRSVLLVARRGIAIAVHRIEAHAELLAGTEAAADIKMTAELGIAAVAGGEAGQGRVVGPFGHQVHRAAHRATGRHAVEQRRRSFQHFDALGQLRCYPIVGNQAVQAAKSDVRRGHAEAADVEVVGDTAARAAAVDTGVGQRDHPHQVRCLDVVDELGRVAGGVERRIHEVQVAEQADAAAACELAPGIR